MVGVRMRGTLKEIERVVRCIELVEDIKGRDVGSESAPGIMVKVLRGVRDIVREEVKKIKGGRGGGGDDDNDDDDDDDDDDDGEEDPGEMHVQCVDLVCAVLAAVHKQVRSRGDKERLCGCGFLDVLGEVLVGVVEIVKQNEEDGINKVLRRKVMEGNTLSMSPTGGGGGGNTGVSISHLSSTLISTIYSGNPLYTGTCISLIHLLLPHLPSIPLTLLTILPLHKHNVEQWVVPVSSIMRTQGVVAR
jgi:hypothetical protein